jgi:hypothetical protein
MGKEVRAGTHNVTALIPGNHNEYSSEEKMKKSLVLLMVVALGLFAFGCKKEENINMTDTAVTDTSGTMMTDTSMTTGTMSTDTMMTDTSGTMTTTDTSMTTGTSSTSSTMSTTTN